MSTITQFAMAFALALGATAEAQTLHSLPNTVDASTNRYFCPPGAPALVATVFGNQVPNLYVPSATLPNTILPQPVLGMNDTVCYDLSKEPGTVALLMQREKHHVDQIAVMQRQAAATEKLATQMDAWMKRAEQNLRSSVDAKFKALPAEIVNSQAHMTSLETLRAEILKEVECKLDPGKSCS